MTLRAAAAAFALATASSAGLLQAAIDPNPTLQSYTAAAQLQATLHGIVPVHKTFTGTAYYKRPKQEIVFDNLAGPLSRFRELTTTLPTQSELAANYRTTPTSDDGTHAQFTAAALAQDTRVRSITFTVDDKARLLTSVVWSYNDGSSLTIDPSFQNVGAYRLPVREEIHARFKDYDADGVLTLSSFRIGSTQTP